MVIVTYFNATIIASALLGMVLFFNVGGGNDASILAQSSTPVNHAKAILLLIVLVIFFAGLSPIFRMINKPLFLLFSQTCSIFLLILGITGTGLRFCAFGLAISFLLLLDFFKVIEAILITSCLNFISILSIVLPTYYDRALFTPRIQTVFMSSMMMKELKSCRKLTMATGAAVVSGGYLGYAIHSHRSFEAVAHARSVSALPGLLMSPLYYTSEA